MYLESLYDVTKFATFAADDTTPYTYYPTGISRTQLRSARKWNFLLTQKELRQRKWVLATNSNIFLSLSTISMVTSSNILLDRWYSMYEISKVYWFGCKLF